MVAYTNLAGTWEETDVPHIKVGSTWKIAKSAWVRLSTEWKSWFLQGGVLDSPVSYEDSYTPSFMYNLASGFNNFLDLVLQQSDGKFILAGRYTNFAGISINRIIRLNSDGTVDSTFLANVGTGADGNVISGALQSDGKIVLGGAFITWNGTTVGRVVRLNSDGTLDTTFASNIGTGASAAVEELVVQSDGKIIIVGSHTTFNNVTNNRVIRLNSDGTPDSAFTTAIGTAASGRVDAVALQSDGKIVLAGNFSTWAGTTVGRIVRLNSDGTRDTALNTNTGTGSTSGTIEDIALQSDGKIVLGGAFTVFNGTTVNRIVRLNSDGTRDTTFTTNTGAAVGGNSVVRVILQPDQKIIVTGTFLTWNSSTVPGTVRLNTDGTLDTTFMTNIGPGPTNSTANIYPADAIFLPSDKIMLVGRFFRWNGRPSPRVAIINLDGTLDLANYNFPGATATVRDLAFDSSNNIYLAGDFSHWDSSPTGCFVKLLYPSYIPDSAFNTNLGTGAPAFSNLRQCFVQPDQKVVIAGDFQSWNGTSIGGIVRLNSNGTLDSAFASAVGTATGGAVLYADLQPDGKILLGGGFTTWNTSTSVGRFVRLNSDGTLDSTFLTNIGSASSSNVFDGAVQSDGKILVGGSFIAWDTTSVNGLVRLNSNGTLDSSFVTNLGTGANAAVGAFAIQGDNKIIVAGDFSTWNSVTVNRIVRLNSDGTVDSAFTTNTGSGANAGMDEVILQEDGKIILNGNFTTWNGNPRGRTVRLNSDGTEDTNFSANFGTGANNSVVQVRSLPNKKLLIVGDFTYVNGSTRARTAIIGGDASYA